MVLQGFWGSTPAEPRNPIDILSETLSPRDPKSEPKSYPFPLIIKGELGSLADRVFDRISDRNFR